MYTNLVGMHQLKLTNTAVSAGVRILRLYPPCRILHKYSNSMVLVTEIVVLSWDRNVDPIQCAEKEIKYAYLVHRRRPAGIY
eukprot:SAG31_NODE_4949_length_2841_cov_1.665573_3_plen_82_part_00